MDLDANSPIPAVGNRASSSQLATRSPGEFDALLKRGLNFWPLLRTIKRKTLLITGITVILTGFAAFRTKEAPLLYQGSFELLVEPVTTQAQLSDPTTLARGTRDAQRFGVTDYATQLRILRSSRLLREIAEKVPSWY